MPQERLDKGWSEGGRWHEGQMFRALPYCICVEGKQAEILDRRYRLIVRLRLRRVPTNQQLKIISCSGEVCEEDDGLRKSWLYNDSCPPWLAWESYATRLKKLGSWTGLGRK